MHLSNIVYTFMRYNLFLSPLTFFNLCAPWFLLYLPQQAVVFWLYLLFFLKKVLLCFNFCSFLHISFFVSGDFHYWDVLFLLFSLSPLISCFFPLPVHNTLLFFLSYLTLLLCFLLLHVIFLSLIHLLPDVSQSLVTYWWLWRALRVFLPLALADVVDTAAHYLLVASTGAWDCPAISLPKCQKDRWTRKCSMQNSRNTRKDSPRSQLPTQILKYVNCLMKISIIFW